MYHIEIVEEARRELKRLPGNTRHRIARLIDSLKHDPRPPEAKAMDDPLQGFWRIRLENYRVVYTIDDDVILVTVVQVTKRDNESYIGLA